MPASPRIGSLWIRQVIEPGPNRPRSGLTSVVDAAGLAARTQAPEGHFGLVDLEPVRLGRVQARRLADGAVDVGDLAAAAADDVMVVVTGPALEPGRAAGGL